MTSTTNKGIHGTNVTISAEALAVGDHANATSTAFSRSEQGSLARAVERLEAAIGLLPLESATRDAVRDDVTRLSEAAHAPQLNREQARTSLSAVVARLSAAGVMVSQVASLIEPVRKIAAAIGGVTL